MIGRAALPMLCLVVTSTYLGHAAKAEPTPIRQPLSDLPLVIGEWTGTVNPDLSPEILAILRVSDYTTRTYFSPRKGVVGLYVGYYGTQRQGASIHSPLNCLPGAGWIPVQQGHLVLTVASSPNGPRRTIEVNRVVIEKGLDRQLVLYWTRATIASSPAEVGRDLHRCRCHSFESYRCCAGTGNRTGQLSRARRVQYR